ncbi:MAG: outer membrane beta-barrel protein, partial [bacterium]|nr:outer membrane beta-barrel protein [bacterium]
ENIAWDGVKLGLVAGAGVEAALSQNWSFKGEYLFVQMDKENVVYDAGSDDDIDFSNRSHLVRIGLNYKFNDLF